MKNIKFLAFVSILFAIVFVVFIINHNNSNKKEIQVFPFDDLLEEINLASNESFDEISSNQITMYLPLAFSTENNLLFAVDVDNANEYFLIANNLDYNQKSQIESLYSNVKEEPNFIFYSDEKYVYVIKSEEYLYMIEGIIDSFIINYENRK